MIFITTTLKNTTTKAIHKIEHVNERFIDCPHCNGLLVLQYKSYYCQRCFTKFTIKEVKKEEK